MEINLDHCVKGVRIRSYSGPYFPAFGLNKERHSVSLRIQSEKIWARINRMRTLLRSEFSVKINTVSGHSKMKQPAFGGADLKIVDWEGDW